MPETKTDTTDQVEEKPYDPSDYVELAPFTPGRPTLYKEWMTLKCFDIMAQGRTVNTVCAAIGICKSTFYVWCKEYPEFMDAHKKGQAAGLAYWERATHDHTMGKAHLTIDAAYIMRMRNDYGQMTRDPDKSEEREQERVDKQAGVKSGGKVTEDKWTATMIRTSHE